MSLISAKEARSNVENFCLSTDEMLKQISDSILTSSKAGKTRAIVSFLYGVVDLKCLESVENILKEKGYRFYTSNNGENIKIDISY